MLPVLPWQAYRSEGGTPKRPRQSSGGEGAIQHNKTAALCQVYVIAYLPILDPALIVDNDAI